MILKFGCENIKAIKEYDEIEIRPVTIILGENSSGKSSILQALSLLYVNNIFGNNIQRIKYNNPFSQFGTNDTFKNKGEKVFFYFELDYEDRTFIKLYYVDDEKDREYGVLERVEIDNNDISFSLILNKKNSYDVKIKEVKSENLRDLKIDTYTFSVSDNLRAVFAPREIIEAYPIFLGALDYLRDELISSIRHIGTIQNKKETYDYPLDYIGYFGEKYKDRLLNLSNIRFIKGAIKKIFDYELYLDKKKREVFLKQDNKKLNFNMFGSSINSTIPILTQFALNREKDLTYEHRLTIIEEPELNLHPKSQAKFVESIFTKVRPDYHYTILETHSDHILNKIRFLVSEKVIKSTDVIVYYKEKDKKFQKIEINKCGEFSKPFPKGFYDATLEDIYSLGRNCK